MNKHLPKLSSMILPAFLTLRKPKRIATAGIRIDKTFKEVEVEKHHLDEFRRYFGFRNTVPLTYVYTVAQRAQTALMLDKRFTLPIPGMVHIENNLTKKGEFNLKNSIDIASSVTVDYKDSGSLKPIFRVEIFQEGHLITSCESIYIIKRKTNKRKDKKAELESLEKIDYQFHWKFNKKMGKEYAKISGDKNPIHTSLLFASILGFKKTIMHGWYSVCKIEQFLENTLDKGISEISTKFLSPVLLPSPGKFELQRTGEAVFKYQLLNSANAKILINGATK